MRRLSYLSFLITIKPYRQAVGYADTTLSKHLWNDLNIPLTFERCKQSPYSRILGDVLDDSPAPVVERQNINRKFSRDFTAFQARKILRSQPVDVEIPGLKRRKLYLKVEIKGPN